jgi:hypothetical protein
MTLTLIAATAIAVAFLVLFFLARMGKALDAADPAAKAWDEAAWGRRRKVFAGVGVAVLVAAAALVVFDAQWHFKGSPAAHECSQKFARLSDARRDCLLGTLTASGE